MNALPCVGVFSTVLQCVLLSGEMIIIVSLLPRVVIFVPELDVCFFLNLCRMSHNNTMTHASSLVCACHR